MIDSLLDVVDGVPATPLDLLAIGAVVLLAVSIVVAYVLDRGGSVEDATRTASSNLFGLTIGAGSVATIAVVEGLSMVAEVPGIVIGLLGVGAILGDISIEIFVAGVVVTYIILATIRRS
jgi:hypothetical protein